MAPWLDEEDVPDVEHAGMSTGSLPLRPPLPLRVINVSHIEPAQYVVESSTDKCQFKMRTSADLTFS